MRGLRYPVEMILDLLGSGMSEILDDYPDLERKDIRAIQAFAGSSSPDSA